MVIIPYMMHKRIKKTNRCFSLRFSGVPQAHLQKWLRHLCVSAVILFATGCGLARPYRCTSELEQTSFNRASRNIHPDDVRITPKGYIGKTVIAWIGPILESSYEELEDSYEVKLLVEHHHFDWLEDFKLGENLYVLSSRGEGRFRTTWHMQKGFGIEEVKRWTAKGNAAVVYGVPVSSEKGIIEIEAYCVRFILHRRIRFSEYPYGRDSGWQY